MPGSLLCLRATRLFHTFIVHMYRVYVVSSVVSVFFIVLRSVGGGARRRLSGARRD